MLPLSFPPSIVILLTGRVINVSSVFCSFSRAILVAAIWIANITIIITMMGNMMLWLIPKLKIAIGGISSTLPLRILAYSMSMGFL